jgi:membrane-associated protein
MVGMGWLGDLFNVFLHLDVHLNDVAGQMGPWVYLLLFGIIFCETGLVLTPFLPGDSLLFAVGALAAGESSALSLPLLIALLFAAAVLGDLVNYLIGYAVGPKVFKYESSWLLNKKHLMEAHRFYEEYGALTIVLARFIPIIRTFAPFVAGIGRMEYHKFGIYNVTGGAAWVLAFLLGGYFLRNLPVVKDNFHIVILGIVVVSVLPAVIKFMIEWQKKRNSAVHHAAQAAVEVE